MKATHGDLKNFPGLFAPLEEARQVVKETVAKAREIGELPIKALDRLYAARPDIRRTWTGK